MGAPDRFLQFFQPGGVLDTVSRLWTPGIQGPNPSPQDDPFYLHHIQRAINGDGPAALMPPGVQHAVDMANQWRDPVTAASTIGTKTQTANKIKKVRGQGQK